MNKESKHVKYADFILKTAVLVSASLGIILSIITAKRDGYSHWTRRMMYFTAQSNVFVAGTYLLIIISIAKGSKNKTMRFIYIIKYLCTVSISLTGIVFCALLAPFSDESYTPWTIPNVLTHVLTPTLTIADHFLDKSNIALRLKHVLLSPIPPLSYFIFSGVLSSFNIDFGRGVSYPYFFLNFNSPAGFFGFSKTVIDHIYYLCYI